VLSIDDDANQAVYGPGTTPRMIFENRAGQRPSDAVVGFRDQLEEASAAARLARSDEAATRPARTAAPAVSTPAIQPPYPQTPPTAPVQAPQPFEPVDSPYSYSPNPPAVQTEPLPPTP
jgi:hypothetical protein